jgi:phosphatidylglycerophosphatase A
VLARELGQHDPGVIVIDEVAGYLLAVALLPTTVTVLVVAFFVFRLLDILKPPPAAQAEALPGGLGVVADDLVAGLMTNLLVRLAIFFGLLV